MPRNLATVAGIVVLVLLGYLLARHWASNALLASAVSLASAKQWPLILRLALFAAFTALAAPLLRLVTRELADRTLHAFALAASAGIAGIGSRLAAVPPLSVQVMWSVAIAGFVALIVATHASTILRRTTIIIVVFACLLMFEVQHGTGFNSRRSWSWRNWDLMADIIYTRERHPQTDVYAEMLARVPRTDCVAIWINRPELVDYEASPRLIDVRIPRVARSGRITKAIRATGCAWMLVEQDDATKGLFDKSTVVVRRGGVQLARFASRPW